MLVRVYLSLSAHLLHAARQSIASIRIATGFMLCFQCGFFLYSITLSSSAHIPCKPSECISKHEYLWLWFSLIVEGFNTLKDFGFSLRQLSLHKLQLRSKKNYFLGYIVPIWLLSTYQVCIQTNIGAVWNTILIFKL